MWRLDRSRREQMHARPRGHYLPRNRPVVEAAERRARAVAASEAMRWADLGTRYLSSLIEQATLHDASGVPSLVFMKVGRRGLEVVLSPTPEGRMGWFCPNEDGTALVLDADIGLEDLQALAEDRWPAWPAMVSLGETKDGALLFNLEHAGSVSVEGSDEAVEGVLAGVALQLTCQPWCDEMLAGLYATGGRPVQAAIPRVARGPQWTEGERILDLAEKLDRVSGAHQDLAGDASLSVLRAVACEALPNAVVAFNGTPAATLTCLAEAAVPERSGVAVVAAGPFEGARWHLELGAAGEASLRGQIDEREVCLELTVNCHPQEVALLSEALGATADHEGPRQPARPETATLGKPVNLNHNGAGGQEPAPLPYPRPDRGDVEICILGAIDVVGGELDALEPSRRMAALGLLAYMASHDRPVSADELASSLWPLDAGKEDLGGPQRKTVMNVISRARSVLGYGIGGKERLVYSPFGYRLADDVTSDWGRFEKFVLRARGLEPADAMACLRSALELVRGQPFGGTMSSQFFEWVASEHLDMTLSAKAVDVAQDLGELALGAGDFATVTWAVDKGLQLEPTREEMFRLWMHALGRAGRPAKVDEVYRRLKLVLRQRIHPLQEPQEESREVWRSYTSAGAPGARD
jgi:DNA-binding SARP family transcriptional activator